MWALPADTPQELRVALCSRVRSVMGRRGWDAGNDMVLLPEYSWMGLGSVLSVRPRQKAARAWPGQLFLGGTLARGARRNCTVPGKAVVFGTAPFETVRSGTLRNRAPILCEGRELHQDKLQLTPRGRSVFSLVRGCLAPLAVQGARHLCRAGVSLDIEDAGNRRRAAGQGSGLPPRAQRHGEPPRRGAHRPLRLGPRGGARLLCGCRPSDHGSLAESELVDQNMGRAALRLVCSARHSTRCPRSKPPAS